MSKMFIGGVPTAMDVDRLMSDLDPQANAQISYADVEAIIGVAHKEYRFKTVTNAWRRRLFREKFLQTVADGEAFHFLSADQALSYGRKGLSRIGRAAGRLRIRVDAINATELSSGELRDKHTLLRRESQAILEAVQKSAKSIAGPRPVSAPSLRLAK